MMPGISSIAICGILLLLARVDIASCQLPTPFEIQSRHLGTKIVGGTVADPTRYPYYTYLVVSYASGGIACGGTLIAPDVVLTAAHCVYEREGNSVLKISAWVSRTSGPSRQSTGYQRTASFHLVHASYDRAISIAKNDIALVFLDEPVTGVPLVKINRDASIPTTGQYLTAIGLGATGSSAPDYLMQVSTPVFSDADCVRVFGKRVVSESFTFCAGGEGKGICYGDSGGPLLRRGASADADTQIGITSFVANNCGSNGVPDGFTRVSYFSDWIDSNVCLYSASTCPVANPSSNASTTRKPTTRKPTTRTPTTRKPTTRTPTTRKPTTRMPTTRNPTTRTPTTRTPTTRRPTTRKPTTRKPTTRKPTTRKPTTRKPTTRKPTTRKPTGKPNV